MLTLALASNAHVFSDKMDERMMKTCVATPTIVHSSCMLIMIDDGGVTKTGFIYYFKD
jgi:hypothetical protein